jgi:twitching motility protein PilT
MDEIIDLIHDGKEQYGSQTFDQHLMDLVHAGAVGFEEAKAAANSPSDFDLKMNLLGGTRGGASSALAPDGEEVAV